MTADTTARSLVWSVAFLGSRPSHWPRQFWKVQRGGVQAGLDGRSEVRLTRTAADNLFACAAQAIATRDLISPPTMVEL